MKRTMMALMITALAAGTALAQEGEGDSQHQKGRSWDREGGGKQAWDQKEDRGEGEQAYRGPMDKHGGSMMTPEMREQMKADHEAIRDLVGAYRLETDEAKKAELVVQIRARLGAIADRMQTLQAQRLSQAEERLADLKKKIEDAKANRDSLIDEQLQRVLSGERPERPDRFKEFPQAKGGHERGGHGEELAPPPPEEDMPADMPPPPEE